MRKIKTKLKTIIDFIFFKYIYISSLILLLPFIVLDVNCNLFSEFYLEQNSLGNLATIAGSFIGFLLTVATVYFALPGKSKFRKWLVEHGHHKIFMNIILFGIVAFFVTIMSWLILSDVFKRIGLYSFVAGCIEVGASVYYLYFLVVKN